MTVALAAIPVLIRDATVHTISTAGTLEHADILIRDGKVADIGRGLAAPAGTEVIEAAGRPVTPGLFGGLTHLGLEEISLEPTVDDFALHSTSLRPEFDVTVAFNADSVVLGVNRILAGVTFAMLTPSVQGSIVAGQGAIARLDGTIVPGARALFVEIGGNAAARTGESRAAQLMLLRQTIDEVREPQSMLPGDRRLLSPAGRRALSVYLDARGPMVFSVDRASDIRRVIAFAHQEGLRAVIKGGAGAWRAADELAAARIPVILNPFDNLPVSFDAMAATVENAVRLNRAGCQNRLQFCRLGAASLPAQIAAGGGRCGRTRTSLGRGHGGAHTKSCGNLWSRRRKRLSRSWPPG